MGKLVMKASGNNESDKMKNQIAHIQKSSDPTWPKWGLFPQSGETVWLGSEQEAYAEAGRRGWTVVPNPPVRWRTHSAGNTGRYFIMWGQVVLATTEGTTSLDEAELMARAPELLSEVTRLRAELNSARESDAAQLRATVAMQAERDRLRAANTALQEALQAIEAECDRQGETEYTYEIGRTVRAVLALAGKEGA